MADSVNFNPITGNPFSSLEIEHLDMNKDGKISSSELTTGMAWLTSQDSESEVSIQDGNELFSRAKSLGVSDSAKTTTEFKSGMAVIVDEFLEMFFDPNVQYTKEEREALQKLISTKSNEFITQYISQNPKGPWDMKVASSQFVEFVDNAIKENKALQKNNESVINAYKDNMDANFLNLMDLTMSANENGNISQAEFNQMKSKAIQYLMGVMLSDGSDKSFFESLDPRYQTNGFYQKALNSINKIKNSNDPAQVQKLLNDAMENLTKFLDSKGGAKFAESVADFKDAQAEENIRKVLGEYIDKYKEAALTPELPAETVAYLEKFLSTALDKFVAKIAEQGNADSYTASDLQAQFASFVEKQMAELLQAQTKAANSVSSIESSYKTLVQVSDNANLNGNISEQEKGKIINAATEMLYSQLISDVTDLDFLKNLSPNYKTSKDFKEIITMVDTLKTSADPDEIKDLAEKIKIALKEYLNNFECSKLVAATDSVKPVEVSESTKDRALYNSSISSDYQAAASRTTESYGKQSEEMLVEIQDMARQDMQIMAEQLKAQLKAELGSAYDESEVDKYINDAMNDTISLFTQNVVRRKRGGSYDAGADEMAFVFERRSGTKKGRYNYNVKALIDTFVNFFNQSSAKKTITKLDPSSATYDRENVIADSLGNDYWRNKSETVYGKNSDEKSYAELIAEATEDLKRVGESLKVSLLSEGLDLTESEINEMVDACIAETISDMKNAFQYCQPNGKVSGGFLKGLGVGSAIGGSAYGTAALVAATAMSAASTASAASVAATAASVSASAALASATSAMGTSTFVAGSHAAAWLAAQSAASAASSAALSSTSAFMSAAAASSAVPIVGWVAAGVGVTLAVLGKCTNIFGATYGKHNQDAGFYFERKSNSKSGNWGYDTQTLVNTFFDKIDAKIAEAKAKKANENKGLENL